MAVENVENVLREMMKITEILADHDVKTAEGILALELIVNMAKHQAGLPISQMSPIVEKIIQCMIVNGANEKGDATNPVIN